MNCLTKLFQQKRRRIGYIQAFSGPMISKRDSSDVGRKIPSGLSLSFTRCILAVGWVVLLAKKLLSILPFTLHLFAWNPDKHWGCEGWRVDETLHRYKCLIYSVLRYVGEGWRAFLRLLGNLSEWNNPNFLFFFLLSQILFHESRGWIMYITKEGW